MMAGPGRHLSLGSEPDQAAWPYKRQEKELQAWKTAGRCADRLWSCLGNWSKALKHF